MKVTAEMRFKECVRSLHMRGIYPGPTAINAELHGKISNHLNGRECRWRYEVFDELNIPYLRPGSRTSMYDLNYPSYPND